MPGRPFIGICVATVAVLASAPGWLVPWAGALRSVLHDPPWPLVSVLVSGCLLLAASLMPASVVGGTPRREGTFLAVGLLLLIEPLIHLLVLAWSAEHPSATSAEAVLPALFGGGNGSPGLWWVQAMAVAVIAPIAEECFFRGRLLPWLMNILPAWRGRTAIAVGLTTAAFAGAHAEIERMLIAVPLGLLLAYVRLSHGSLRGCVLVHAGHNILFMFSGAALMGTPWVAPILAMGGTILIALSCLYRQHDVRPHRHLHATALVLACVSLIVLTYPAFRMLQNDLWVRAAHRLIILWRVDTDVLLMRLEQQRALGRLGLERRTALYDLLSQQTCQIFAGRSNPRQICTLAVLDPERAAASVDADQAYDRLLDLADCARTLPHVIDTARRIGLNHPDIFASLSSAQPDVLARWLPLPQAGKACLAQLVATTGAHRRMFLSALERANPGQVADVIVQLPADQITPLDRRHLYAHYDDAVERVKVLNNNDPQRARAFAGE